MVCLSERFFLKLAVYSRRPPCPPCCRWPIAVAVEDFETCYRGREAGVGGGCDVMLFGGGGGFDEHVALLVIARLDHLDELDGRYVACVT